MLLLLHQVKATMAKFYSAALFPALMFHVTCATYHHSFKIIMVTASYQCCKECRFLYNHTCSTKKYATVDESFISTSFDRTTKCKICAKLHVICYRKKKEQKEAVMNKVTSNVPPAPPLPS